MKRRRKMTSIPTHSSLLKDLNGAMLIFIKKKMPRSSMTYSTSITLKMIRVLLDSTTPLNSSSGLSVLLDISQNGTLESELPRLRNCSHSSQEFQLILQ